MTKIIDIVQDLLQKQGMSKAPIPIEKVVHNLGIELRYEPFSEQGEDVSGMLFRDGERTVIGINANESPRRQRFTIAHEIGHLFLHKDPIYLDTPAEVFMRRHHSSRAVDPKELQANSFAAELLMPEKMVRAEAEGAQAQMAKLAAVISEEDLVERLADKFDVSVQAMTFRLAQLGLVKL